MNKKNDISMFQIWVLAKINMFLQFYVSINC